MTIDWTHAAPATLAAFLASLVEFVEALTVVLAVGATRGWRGALGGAGLALAALSLLVAVLGPALTRIPLDLIQLGVGSLLLVFGLRWLRKAVLRAAGVIALRDEDAAYARTRQGLGGATGSGWDRVAMATTFKITMIEGIEVVFVVIAVGAGGGGLLLPASLGAGAALLVVAILGLVLHRPVSMIPENALKLIVGVLLSGFGTFWIGEGVGLAWPGADWSLPVLILGFAAAAAIAVPICRARRQAR